MPVRPQARHMCMSSDVGEDIVAVGLKLLRQPIASHGVEDAPYRMVGEHQNYVAMVLRVF